MITPGEIRTKAERKYLAFLKARSRGESFFPLRIPARMAASSTDYTTLSHWLQTIVAKSKSKHGWGYSLEWSAEIRTRTHGHQSLPTGILIETEHDFLRLIGKEEEFQSWTQSLALLRTRYPRIAEWACDHPKHILTQLGNWPNLLMVVDYFKAHPRPNVYMRDLPLELDTKFVETHRGILQELLLLVLPPEAIHSAGTDFVERFGLRKPPFMVRIRMLDPALQAMAALPVDDMALPLDALVDLPLANREVIVVENLASFLSLPSRPNTLAIWGEGAKVAGLIVPWLATCRVRYWGDLDVQGFQFLARFRSHFPEVSSWLMDQATLEAHRQYVVSGTVDKSAPPDRLSDAERLVYLELQAGNLRLEQERVGYGWWMGRF